MVSGMGVHREPGDPGGGNSLIFTVRPFGSLGWPDVKLKSCSVADFDADFGATASTYKTKKPGKKVEGRELGYWSGA
jgi:hypothetical protein